MHDLVYITPRCHCDGDPRVNGGTKMVCNGGSGGADSLKKRFFCPKCDAKVSLTFSTKTRLDPEDD